MKLFQLIFEENVLIKSFYPEKNSHDKKKYFPLVLYVSIYSM